MKTCKKCSGSGWYVDYGGFDVGGVLVPCKACDGKGWLSPEDVPQRGE